MSWAFVGGRDRDRTCDPYHVNEGRGEEEAEIRALGESSTVALGMTFLACSGSAVQRTKGHYVALRRPPRPLRKDEQQQMPKPRHIEGRHATRVATEVAMREPVRLSADAGDEHRPGPFDVLDEATLNAAIAVIASVKPQSELEALIAVQIVATGFTGLKFLKHSQRHLDETFIGVYGGYATRLLRLQLDLIQALDKHRRGHNQTVEVRHVHIHPGGQGVVGIVNSGKEGGGGGEREK
jgi:hypothetical protein